MASAEAARAAAQLSAYHPALRGVDAHVAPALPARDPRRRRPLASSVQTVPQTPPTPYQLKSEKMAEIARLEAVNGGATWQAPPPPYQPASYASSSPLSAASDASFGRSSFASSSSSTLSTSPTSTVPMQTAAEHALDALETQFGTQLRLLHHLNTAPPPLPPMSMERQARAPTQPDPFAQDTSASDFLRELHESQLVRESLERRVRQLEEEKRLRASTRAENRERRQRRDNRLHPLLRPTRPINVRENLKRNSLSDDYLTSPSSEDSMSFSDDSHSTAPTEPDTEHDEHSLHSSPSPDKTSDDVASSASPLGIPYISTAHIGSHARSISMTESKQAFDEARPPSWAASTKTTGPSRSFSAASWVHKRSVSASSVLSSTSFFVPNRRASVDATLPRRRLLRRKVTSPVASTIETVGEQEEPQSDDELERENKLQKEREKAFYDLRKPTFWMLIAPGSGRDVRLL